MTSPQARRATRPIHVAGRVFLALAVLVITAWALLAMSYQLAQPYLRYPALVVWCAVAGGWVYAIVQGHRRALMVRLGWMFGLMTLLLFAWWHSLAPTHDRDWADDVAYLLESDVDGDLVTLRNVRNFEWRSETDYTPRWETRQYRLDQLETADLILSYWMGPHIAHTLVSFGFSDGQRLAFSLEIRKERHEAFTAIGGFFRTFEQIFVAADERDIIRTRSNVRGEDVYLYSLDVSREHLRAMFLGYLQEADTLRRNPRFYNTLTSNCTTVIFEMARHIVPALPIDHRLLVSGHFAEYAYDHGALVPGYSYAQLQALGHINARAWQADAAHLPFSQAIRHQVPRVGNDDRP